MQINQVKEPLKKNNTNAEEKVRNFDLFFTMKLKRLVKETTPDEGLFGSIKELQIGNDELTPGDFC